MKSSNGQDSHGPRSNMPKIRQSCDNCQRSKVRCSQDRPVCSRCLKHGSGCIYSLSRRVGRPRLRRDTGSSSKSVEARTPKTRPTYSQIPSPSETATIADARGSKFTLERTPPQSAGHTFQSAYLTAQTSITQLETASHQEISLVSPPVSTIQPMHVSEYGTEEVNGQSRDIFPATAEYFDYSMDLPGYLSTDNHDCYGQPVFPQDLTSFGHDAAFANMSKFDYPLCFDDGSRGTELDSISMAGPNTPSTLALLSTSSSGHSDSSTCSTSSSQASDCNCAFRLLNHLAQTSPSRSIGNETSSRVATAIHSTKEILRLCKELLQCPRCSARWSTIMLMCEAVDRFSIALEVGSIWAKGSRDLVQNCLVRKNLPVQCGNYFVPSSDRTLVLKALLSNRMNELQRNMEKVQLIVASLNMVAATVSHKTCVDLAAEVSSNLTSRAEMIMSIF